MKKILLSFFISIMLIACIQKTVSVKFGQKSRLMSGISNGDGFVGVILFRARQSTKWRCSRQILLIRLLLIVNWVGRKK